MTNIEDRTKREVRKFLKSLTPEQSRCFGKCMYSLLDAAGGDPKDPVLLNAVGQIGMAMRTGYIDLVEHSDGEIGIRLTEKGRPRIATS